MMLVLAITGFVLLSVLTLASYVERIYAEMGKFLSREFQENIEAFEQKVEPRLRTGRDRIQLTMSVLAQLSTAGVAMLVAYSVFRDAQWTGRDLAEAAAALVIVVIVFNRFLPFVLFTRTRGEWLEEFVPLLRVMIYASLPVTMVLSFVLSVAALAEEHAPEEPEHPSEAVDALIEAGQEEGILHETDPQLIHSVVEFGEKTVREVMTPRPEIVAVPTETTVEQLIELMRAKPYSRVPVYEGTLDKIRGIVFAHDVLQIADTEARTQTVGLLMKPVMFVPVTKKVGALLKELQKNNMHMAIVVDEYGGVAGVTTIEDLVEEIVGEIRDEHEAKADIVRESDTSYVVPGNMDVDRLVELFGVRPEGREATSVGGLVSELVGRIPERGEVVEDDGLRYEVLESTRRRIERMRISTRKT
ncbi:MAG: hemolysin family protein [Terriglobales bacterium]